MTHTEHIARWRAVVDKVVSDYKNLDKACNAARKAGTLDIYGKLSNVIWETFGDMMTIIDPSGWIEWYIFDNELGACQFEANSVHGHPMRKIKSTRHLATLIVESIEAEAEKT